eukprot:Platyproteum_vivax@DN2019_c0_g1_i1.p1
MMHLSNSTIEVCDQSMVFLHMAMVKYAMENSNNDTTVAAEKLEEMGFEVGARLAERLSIGRLPMADDKDCVKFVCKEIWIAVFQKQVDRLQTNRRGGFVIHDLKFRWLTYYSPNVDKENSQRIEIPPSMYHCFACGVIRGALASFQILVRVTGDSLPDGPQCRQFNVRILNNNLSISTTPPSTQTNLAPTN